jgi:hypothetical protein
MESIQLSPPQLLQVAVHAGLVVIVALQYLILLQLLKIKYNQVPRQPLLEVVVDKLQPQQRQASRPLLLPQL